MTSLIGGAAGGAGGLYPPGSTEPKFAAPGFDVDDQCVWYKQSGRSHTSQGSSAQHRRGLA